MLAILGLMSVALAAVFISDSDTPEDAEKAASDQLSNSDQALETVSIDNLIDSDATLITGTETNDKIIGGNSANIIAGDNGDDQILGNGGDDWLHGGDGDDILDGGDANDELHAGDGNDTANGGKGNDLLKGYGGADTLFGDDGDDLLMGGSGDDQLYGGDGDDELSGSFGNDRLAGGDGVDTLFGGLGNNELIGNDDDTGDYLNGSDGDDLLRGGIDDHLFGSAGRDTFAIDTAAGAIVSDFDPTLDKIEVHYNFADGPPSLSVIAHSQGSTLLANDEVVAYFTNGQIVEIGQIKAVAVDPIK